MSLANTNVRALVFVAVFALLVMGIIAAPAPAALAGQNSCPSGGTPPPGSTVDGGLDVDGVCIVDGVTVNGGITVEAGGHLQLQSSTVNGGILALPCGELDVNATTLGAGVPTGTSATIHGGIDIEVGMPTIGIEPKSAIKSQWAATPRWLIGIDRGPLGSWPVRCWRTRRSPWSR